MALSAPRSFPMHTFSGGVLSRMLDARSDTEKYYTSARRLHNVQVLRSGAAANRAGLKYIAPVKSAGAILLPWVFDEDDRYILELGDGYIRFFQDDAHIVTDGLTQAWSSAKTYVLGDLVLAGGASPFYYCKATNTGANPPFAPALWYPLTVYPPSVSLPVPVAIYEIPSPYHADVLLDVRVVQSADVMWLVHPSHPPYELKRYAHTKWTMQPADFAPSIKGPLFLNASGGASGSVARRYKVTAVKGETFIESLPGAIVRTVTGSLSKAGPTANLLVTSPVVHGLATGQTLFVTDVFPTTGTLNLAFETQLEGQFFNANVLTATTVELSNTAGIALPAGYSLTLWGASAPGGSVFGATATGTVFDNGKLQAAGHGLTTGDELLILALGGSTSEAKAALVGKTFYVTVLSVDEFALDDSDGIDWTNDVDLVYVSRTHITRTAASPGYGEITLTWNAVPGAEKYYVYNQLNGVYGYLATVAGTTFVDRSSDNVSPDTADAPPRYYNPFRGVNKRPSCVALHDQRLIFAGTNTKPADFWMSKVGDFLNFTHASPYKDDDAITGTIVGAQEIRHLLSLDTLIVLSNNGLYFIEGDADGDITHASVRVRHRGRVGSGDLPPLVIDDSALFSESRSILVRDFRLDAVEFQKGRDITVYAPALFDGFELRQWCYQRIPQSILWAVRSDGILLANTYVREQEIAAWHTHDTGRSGLYDNGFGVLVGDPTQDVGFTSVAVVPEGNEDALYAIVERTINPVYQFDALYEPPAGYIIHGLGHHFDESQNQYVEALGGTLLTEKELSGSGGFPIRVTSTLTPPVGTGVYLKDAFPTVGDPDEDFDERVIDQAYYVSAISAGEWFEITGYEDPILPAIPAVPSDYVGTFRVLDAPFRPAVNGIPPNIGKNSAHHGVIPGYTGPLPNPDPLWWRGTSTAEYTQTFALMEAQGAIPTVAFTVQDQVADPIEGADLVFHDHDPVNQYEGMVAQLGELSAAIAAWNKPIFVSIGPECNSPGMHYNRATWVETFRAIYNLMKAQTQAITPAAWQKVAIIFSTEITPTPDLVSYYPGDSFVHWCAVDLFNSETNLTDGTQSFENMKTWLTFFEGHRKPVSIQEAGCVGRNIPTILPDADHGGDDETAEENADSVWNTWWVPFFRTLDRFPIIKLWRYVNKNHTGTAFAAPPQFWANARVDINHFLFDRIKAQIREGRYIHADQKSLLKDWRRFTGLSLEPTATTTRTVERLRPRLAGVDDVDHKTDSFFVDSGETFDGRIESHPEWAGITLTISAVSENPLETPLWVEGETVKLTSSVPLFDVTDVTQVGFLLTDPVTGEEGEVLITNFVSDVEVHVLLVTDVPPGLRAGASAASVWTRMVRSLSGLERLEGRLLSVFADGLRQPQVAVANGAVYFYKPLGYGHLGLPITAEIDTLDLDAPGQGVVGQGVRSAELTVLVHNTRGARAGLATSRRLFPLVATPQKVIDELELFTGKMRVSMQSGSQRQSSIRLQQKDPLPMLIAGLFPRTEVAR